ncbi:DUF1254 domain-containing protein [Paraburkholderia tropica]|uniref:DUF1254 domain-containing protein n=2 Tax=Paraburkholderia tropica TaxID=92647 RepID=A0ABX5MMF5_9BURK|nr:DUF1254 domain-containing protein [Paraburkholderia tropica]PXX14195.1 hypothetical protein C7400_113129 [Paraburkholderia tropica]PZW79031.1 hypothetical protein C7399_113129 [Paraburkholderia tropica]
MYTQAMSRIDPRARSDEDPVVALVKMAAGPLALARYPVVEVMRTCALHTQPHSRSPLRAPFNALYASDRRWTHEDRDIVTPANDFLYLNAWIDLSNGPVVLDLPAVESTRYFVIELLDAFTNNFANLGPRNVGTRGARVVLHAPGQQPTGDGTPVSCPTALVWLLGRVLVQSDDDLPRARDAARAFRLNGPVCAGPQCVRDWQESGDDALDFFQHVFDAFADLPPRADEAAAFGMLVRAGLREHGRTDVRALPETVQHGLRLAYADAQRLLLAFTQSRTRRNWVYSLELGRYGHAHLLRACIAMKGLGALASEEAVYATADFDDAGEHLHGARRYSLHFAPGQLPPVDALWSLSLYGADRYFVDNPIPRYAIGDRTPGLRYDADGGLRIAIQHEAPADPHANWLPAPPDGFYLILRFYHPQAAFLEGRYAIPPVQNVSPVNA